MALAKPLARLYQISLWDNSVPLQYKKQLNKLYNEEILSAVV